MNYKFNLFKKKIIDKFPQLQRWLKFNYGLIIEELKETDYIMGASPLTKKILQSDGQWIDFLPTDERQQGRRIESMACTNFGALNVVEILANKKGYGIWDKSDRHSAKTSGTSRNGNLQSRVLDAARKDFGLVMQELWPNNIDDFNWNEFYASIPQDVLDKGISFVNDYELGYEAVWSTPNALKEALKYSPLYVAGFAWAENGGLHRSYGNPNHAFTLVGYKDREYWLAYDSYEPFLKKLAWNYKIYYPKIITLNKRNEIYNLEVIKDRITKGLEWIMRPEGHGEIYKIENDNLAYKTNQQFVNEQILKMKDEGKLLMVNEEYFNNLLK